MAATRGTPTPTSSIHHRLSNINARWSVVSSDTSTSTRVRKLGLGCPLRHQIHATAPPTCKRREVEHASGRRGPDGHPLSGTGKLPWHLFKHAFLKLWKTKEPVESWKTPSPRKASNKRPKAPSPHLGHPHQPLAESPAGAPSRRRSVGTWLWQDLESQVSAYAGVCCEHKHSSG